jgi:DNA polymerase-1
MAGKVEAEESVGKESDHSAKKHFLNRAGEILEYLLGLIEFKREDIAIANSSRCWKEGNKKPTNVELNSCFPHLMKELSEIKPKLVIAMGDVALYQSTGLDHITTYHGKLLWSDKINCLVYPIYHPMAVGYDPSKKEDLIADFKRIPTLLGEKPFEIKHYLYKVIDTKEKFDSIFDELNNSEFLYFDIETTGLDAFKDEIVIMQIGTGKEPIYIFPFNFAKQIQPELKSIIEKSKIIGQDFKFDVKFIYNKLNIFPENWYHDTCLAEYLLTGMKDNDLDALTDKYVPESSGYSKEVNEIGGAHLVKDDNLLYQYASDDIGVLPKIEKNQIKEIYKRDIEFLFRDITMQNNKVLADMELNGVRIDLDRLWELDAVYEKKAQKVLNKALLLPEVQQTERDLNQRFKPKSAVHLKHLLYDVYQLPILKKTKKGGVSTDKELMKIYSEAPYKNKYCAIMEQYRSYENIRSTFLSGVIPQLDGDIAHTTYSLHATTTGRPVSKNPNLLNLPTKEKEIKEIYIPRDGYVFLYFDLKAIEMRVASVIYWDDVLINICNSGWDIHTQTAVEILGGDYESLQSLYELKDHDATMKRRVAKTINFGIIYGQGAHGLAEELNIKESVAEEYIYNYFLRFKGLKKGIDDIQKFAIDKGYVETYFGLRRYWKDHTVENLNMLREAQNTPVQGTAWQLSQLIQIGSRNFVKKYNFDAKMVIQMYDAVVIECREKDIIDIAPEIINIVENVNKPFPILNEVKIKADIEIGRKNMAKLEEIKK